MEYLFTERQRFSQWWMWLLILGINAFVVVMIVQQLADHTTNIGLWFALLIMLLITIGFYLLQLETRISKEGIEVRFFPFHLSYIKISWEKVKNAEIRQYKPLSEYGGWGLRYGRAGKAYNVSGNIGLQLSFEDGKSLLIGTQKKEELETVLGIVWP